MDIYTVLALLLVVFACSTLLGYWAGVARKREDRLKDKARGWKVGFLAGGTTYATGKTTHAINPYTVELERRRAR